MKKLGDVCNLGHLLTQGNAYCKASGQVCCKTCASASNKLHRQQHPTYHRNRKVADTYGMEDYLREREELLSEQGNACAICGITGLTWGKGFMRVWHVDHPHGQEGTHRGVLCAACNTALGRLEPHLDKVLAYLAKYAVEQGTVHQTT